MTSGLMIVFGVGTFAVLLGAICMLKEEKVDKSEEISSSALKLKNAILAKQL